MLLAGITDESIFYYYNIHILLLVLNVLFLRWIGHQAGHCGPCTHPPAPHCPPPDFCLWKNFTQKVWSEKGENAEARKTVQQDQVITVYSVSKVKDLYLLLKGYRYNSEPHPLSCFVDAEIPTRWKKLTPWWPDCSHDITCHNSENWPQRNGNKSTLELKTNCT